MVTRVPAGEDWLVREINALRSEMQSLKSSVAGLQAIKAQADILAATSKVSELTFAFSASFTGFHPDFVKIDKPAWANSAFLICGIQEVSNSLSLAVDGMRVVSIVARSTSDTSTPSLLEYLAGAESYTGFSDVHVGTFSLATDASIWIRPSIVTDGSPGTGACTLKASIFAYWIK